MGGCEGQKYSPFIVISINWNLFGKTYFQCFVILNDRTPMYTAAHHIERTVILPHRQIFVCVESNKASILANINRPLRRGMADTCPAVQQMKGNFTILATFVQDINCHDTAELHTLCAVALGGYAKYILQQWWDVNKHSPVA